MSKLIEDYTGMETGLRQTIAREEEAAILKAADLLSDEGEKPPISIYRTKQPRKEILKNEP